MKDANYRKYNDHSHNSSTYHKKDGTPVRAILKREAEEEIKNYETHPPSDNPPECDDPNCEFVRTVDGGWRKVTAERAKIVKSIPPIEELLPEIEINKESE